MVQMSEHCRLTLTPVSIDLGNTSKNRKHARSSAWRNLAVAVAKGMVGMKSITAWANCSDGCSPTQPSGSSRLFSSLNAGVEDKGCGM